jgi:hypothetical protein
MDGGEEEVVYAISSPAPNIGQNFLNTRTKTFMYQNDKLNTTTTT